MEGKQETMKHREEVSLRIGQIIGELVERAFNHDHSKILSPEAELLEEYTPKLADSTYGSAEYKGFLVGLKPALDHHYAVNRHHPEHFPNGINGMTLVDLVEMFCDWKAASMRHKDGDIMRSIDLCAERFGMSPQLKQIFINTAKELYG